MIYYEKFESLSHYQLNDSSLLQIAIIILKILALHIGFKNDDRTFIRNC